MPTHEGREFGYDSQVWLNYANGRQTIAEITDPTSAPYIAKAGRSHYYLHEDGTFQRVRISSDGGSVLEVGHVLGYSWTPKRS